ncbi:hypothetical protein ES707_19385 [subsurface metagenome]
MKTQLMIVDPMSLRIEAQKAAKAGQPVFVTQYNEKITGTLRGKFGRIIWDGIDFIFFPEKEKEEGLKP